MEYLIGLDIGTTSTKAVAFDFTGRLIKLVSIGYPLIAPREGWFEQDPDLLFYTVEKAVKELTWELGKAPVAISFSSAMHGLLLIDEHGKPLTNVLIWADTRSYQEATDLRQTVEGKQVYLESGTPVHPMSPLCKIMWLQKNRQDLVGKTSRYISFKEYLLKEWLGLYITDESLASATGLYNIHRHRWNDLSLSLAGITEQQLPEAVPTTTVFQNLKPSVLSRLGIDPSTRIVIGASDGCLANLGSGVLEPDSASLTVGTSSAFRKTTHTSVRDEQQRVFNYILTDKLYVVGGPSNNGGVVAEWFQKQFCNGEMLLEEMATTPPGSEGLLFLPYLLGERAPIWNAEARGVFFGVHMNHTKQHFNRAVWEGIFLAVQSISASVEEVGGPVDKVVVSGGFAKSELLVQMVADILQKQVYLCSSAESSAYGAALLGMHAIGEMSDLLQAKQMVRLEKEFVPDSGKSPVYQAMQEKFKRIYEKLKDEFTG